MRTIKKVFLLVLAMLGVASVKAEDIQIGDLYYRFNSDSATVTGCSKNLDNAVIPDSVEYEGNIYHVYTIGRRAFSNRQKLVSAIIPNSVTIIEDDAFSSCHLLSMVTIGSGVDSIGNWAFSGCDALNAVIIVDLSSWCAIRLGAANPLYVAHHLYMNGNLITELTIPDDVTSISATAFMGAEDLVSTSLPEGLETIGDYAFANCTEIKTIYCKNPTPPEGSGEKHPFSGMSSSARIYVPIGSGALYKQHPVWKYYKIVEFDFSSALSEQPSQKDCNGVKYIQNTEKIMLKIVNKLQMLVQTT